MESESKIRELESIWPLMEKNFSIRERRSFEQHKGLLENPRYHLDTIRHEGAVIGFLSYWNLAECVFWEHVAIARALRGQGLGGAFLQSVLSGVNGLVVLETEIPQSDEPALQANRRLQFYARLGFVRQPYPYYQPAYDGSGEKMPFIMMASGGVLAEKDFIRVRRGIFKEVYGVCGPELEKGVMPF